MACETTFSTSIDAKGDITCKRADTFNLKLAVTHEDDASPHDLTIYDSIKMHIKVSAKDTTHVLAFNTTDGTLLVYDTNKIELKQVATIMQMESKSYVYDAEAKQGANVSTLFGGTFNVTEDVTREGDTPAL